VEHYTTGTVSFELLMRENVKNRAKHIAFAASALCVLGPFSAPAQEPATLDFMVSFVQETCLNCHGGDSTKAGIDLSAFTTDLDLWKDPSTWTRVLDAITDGMMPPDSELPLTDAERATTSTWIQHTLDNVDYDRIPHNPGFVPPRRLTGKEYNYTVQDLFGLGSDPVYAFPEDLVIGDAFDNDSGTLSVEPLWFEKALDAADATVRAVWSDADALEQLLVAVPSIPPVEDRAFYVTSANESQAIDTGGDNYAAVARVKGKPGRIFLRAPRGDDFERGSKELLFEGDALVWRIGRRQVLRAEGLGIADDETHWVGLSVRDGQASLYLDGRLLVSRSDFTRADMEGHLLKVGAKPRERRRRRRRQPTNTGQLEVVKFFADGLPSELMSTVTVKAGDAQLPTATFRWITGMETPGPVNFLTVEDAVDKVLTNFLSGAFRRPPTDEELTRYKALMQEGLDSGLVFELALQHPVTTALSSPAFLFRSEATADTEDAYPVTSMDMANRLSYFLWSSMPDEELLLAAESGRLTDPEELIRQTDRMLADDKAQRFFDRFVLQWLRTGGLGDTVRPDADRFPEVTDSLLAAMRKEGTMLFESAVQENLSPMRLLDGPSTFMNEELAAHYGYTDVTGPEWREVPLKDPTRGGLLTQAGVLTVTSSPRRTSPVFRGIWILEVLLGEPPPPPPAAVPDLPSEVKPGGTSLRQLLEAHRAQKACAGCHSRIDPYGLALEQYDPVGIIRTEPQDTETVLRTGKMLDGIEDLKRHLLEDKKTGFTRHLTKKILSYALGRELRFPDERPVQSIVSQLEGENSGMRSLIYEIVLSEPFRYRMNPTSSTYVAYLEE
jgi:hypothetical protein